MNKNLLFLLAFCFMGALVARGRNGPDYRAATDLPELGIRVRLPLQSVEQPLPPLQRHSYRLRHGDREWTEDRFDPREVWYRTQHAGQWRDLKGNLLILARVTHRKPAGFDFPHVTREQYDERLAATCPDLSEADISMLQAWAGDFLGIDAGPPEPLRFQTFNVRAAAFLPTADPQRLMFVFRVNTRTRGGMSALARTFAVELRLAPGADPERARRNFEQHFLRNIDNLASRAATVDVSPGRPAEEDLTAEDDEVMRRSREDARRSVANLDGWWHADTPHYIILSNQRRGAGQLIRVIEQDLEIMRPAFARLVSSQSTIRNVSIIRVFATGEEYREYVGPARAWTAGIWDEARGELVIRPAPVTPGGDARAAMLRTIYHEAFHQYLSHAAFPARACAWFNEGHATFFEHVTLRGGRISFNEFEPFVQKVGEMPLANLFAMDYETFYDDQPDNRQRNYATAWALIYYLQRAAASEQHFAFGNLAIDYMSALENQGDGTKATRAVLERYNLAALERDYLEFWRSARRRRFAQRASPLPE